MSDVMEDLEKLLKERHSLEDEEEGLVKQISQVNDVVDEMGGLRHQVERDFQEEAKDLIGSRYQGEILQDNADIKQGILRSNAFLEDLLGSLKKQLNRKREKIDEVEGLIKKYREKQSNSDEDDKKQ